MVHPINLYFSTLLEIMCLFALSVPVFYGEFSLVVVSSWFCQLFYCGARLVEYTSGNYKVQLRFTCSFKTSFQDITTFFKTVHLLYTTYPVVAIMITFTFLLWKLSSALGWLWLDGFKFKTNNSFCVTWQQINSIKLINNNYGSPS